MTTKSLIATLLVALPAAAAPAFAQEFPRPDAEFVSTKTRADVVNDLILSQANSTWPIADHAYPVLENKSVRTREEVVAELQNALASGAMEFRNTTYPTDHIVGTPKTRAQVREELEAYLAAGGSVSPTNR